MFTRTSMFAALLVMSSLTSCITNSLWDDPPGVPAERVLAAGLLDSHQLVVEIGFRDGTNVLFVYELENFPPPDELFRCNPAGREVLAATSTMELPAGTRDSKHGIRFPAGSSLHLSVVPPRTLVVTTRDPARESERELEGTYHLEQVTIPNEGVNWNKPENWLRALVTIPAVALDVLTSPIQLVWIFYMLSTHQME